MALLSRSKMRAETVALQDKKAALQREIENEMRAYLRENAATINAAMIVCSFGWSRPEIRIELHNLPSVTQRKIATHNAMDVSRVPDLSVICQQIRARIANETTEDRISKLVSDPESKAALEAMLDALHRPAAPALQNGSR